MSVCLPGVFGSSEGIGFPGTGLTDSWVLGVNLGLLEEQSVLLTTEPSPLSLLLNEPGPGAPWLLGGLL